MNPFGQSDTAAQLFGLIELLAKRDHDSMCGLLTARSESVDADGQLHVKCTCGKEDAQNVVARVRGAIGTSDAVKQKAEEFQLFGEALDEFTRAANDLLVTYDNEPRSMPREPFRRLARALGILEARREAMMPPRPTGDKLSS